MHSVESQDEPQLQSTKTTSQWNTKMLHAHQDKTSNNATSQTKIKTYDSMYTLLASVRLSVKRMYQSKDHSLFWLISDMQATQPTI